MMRVMHNHRAAAYNAVSEYQALQIKPQGIGAAHCPEYMLKAAQQA